MTQHEAEREEERGNGQGRGSSRAIQAARNLSLAVTTGAELLAAMGKEQDQSASERSQALTEWVRLRAALAVVLELLSGAYGASHNRQREILRIAETFTRAVLAKGEPERSAAEWVTVLLLGEEGGAR